MAEAEAEANGLATAVAVVRCCVASYAAMRSVGFLVRVLSAVCLSLVDCTRVSQQQRPSTVDWIDLSAGWVCCSA